jgi:hypothetical protein
VLAFDDGALHLEAGRGAGVLRAAHASDEVEGVGFEAAFAEEFVVEVEGDDFSDDEVAGDGLSEVEDLVQLALEADGRGGDLGCADELRGAGGEVGEFEFVDAVFVFAAGDVHGFGEFEGDDVDDEFARLADVEERAFGLGSVGKASGAGGEAEHGRRGGDGVEEREGREVGRAVLAESGDPGDGAGSDGDQESAVEFAGGKLVGAEVHGSSVAWASELRVSSCRILKRRGQ